MRNPSYPYYLIRGLKNDIAMHLFVDLFKYSDGDIVVKLLKY